jgi:aspartyl-tRNA(Asn)/glutamyl-tRNA(Gln) amidotransferase subunit B
MHAMAEREVMCGLEIHGYLNMENKTKLFCDDRIDADAVPNTNVCPICTGQPGAKPMLPNRQAVEKIVAIGLLLNCNINKRLLFQRKHYSWPDLPNCYQRTISGSYSVPVGVDGDFLGIGISDIHLEEDPARWDPVTGQVDYNRSGFPLVEIVTKPDFTSSDQVREWLKKLVTALSYIKAIDPDAGIKSDVNVSVKPDFNRVEVKNVNSFKSIVKAIEHEILRQKKEIADGKRIVSNTMAWDEKFEKTTFMRSKESAQDYMFIPEPDLPAVIIKQDFIDEISKTLPEKPEDKISAYIKKGVAKEDAEVLSGDLFLAELFEKVVKDISPALAGRFFRKELLRIANFQKKAVEELKITEKHLIPLLKLLSEKKITEETARKIMEKLGVEPFDVIEYVKNENLSAVSDESSITAFCKEAIKENDKAIADYKAGKEIALNYVVGQVMRKSKGKASPDQVNRILRELLGK